MPQIFEEPLRNLVRFTGNVAVLGNLQVNRDLKVYDADESSFVSILDYIKTHGSSIKFEVRHFHDSIQTQEALVQEVNNYLNSSSATDQEKSSIWFLQRDSSTTSTDNVYDEYVFQIDDETTKTGHLERIGSTKASEIFMEDVPVDATFGHDLTVKGSATFQGPVILQDTVVIGEDVNILPQNDEQKLVVANEFVATENWVLSLEGSQKIVSVEKDAQNKAEVTMRGGVWYKIDPAATSIVVTGNSQITDKVITTRIAVAPGENAPLSAGWLTAGENTILRWQYSEPVIDSNAHVYVISLVQVAPATSTEASVILANIESIILAGTSTEQQVSSVGLVPSEYQVITNRGQRIVTVNPATDTVTMKHDTVYYIDVQNMTSSDVIDLRNVFDVVAVQIGEGFEYSATAEIWIECGAQVPAINSWPTTWRWLHTLNPTTAPNLTANSTNCFVVRRDKKGVLINLAYT